MKRALKERFYKSVEWKADKLFYFFDRLRLYRIADMCCDIADWAYDRWLAVR